MGGGEGKRKKTKFEITCSVCRDSFVVVLFCFLFVMILRSFEGTGGLTVTDVRRERIPLLWEHRIGYPFPGRHSSVVQPSGQASAMPSATLVEYLYRNSAATYAWFDDFVEMMDKVNEGNSNIILLGDFNIDLLKSQPAWESTTSLFGLHQLITCATAVNQTQLTGAVLCDLKKAFDPISHLYSRNYQFIL